jgi:hypothetical protein
MSDNNRSSAYDKLSDSIDSKLLNFNLKVFALAGALLLRPMAIATDPFFRKNLGCRYFTPMTAFMAGGLWFVASRLDQLFDRLPSIAYESGNPHLAQWLVAHNCSSWAGTVMLALYSFLAMLNLGAAVTRERKGISWHSMSRGESILGGEHPILSFILGFLLFSVLSAVSPFVGLFFGVSRVMSYQLARKQQQSIYARYLDAMDAKIEQEHLECALRDAPSPKKTTGLYCPLPERIKGEHRANVARIVASSLMRPAPAVDQRPAPGTATTTQAPTTTPAPNPVELPDLSGPLNQVSQMLLRNRRIMLQLVITSGIFLAVIWAVTQMLNSPAASTPRPTTPAPVSSTVSQPTPKPPSRPVAVAPAAPVLATPVQPKEDASALAAQAEAQRQRALEALRKEAQRIALANQKRREELIELATTTIKEQADSVARFQEACEARYAANPKKIDGLSYSSRKFLREQNDKFYGMFTNVAASQQEIMAQKQAELRALSTDTNADPTAFCNELGPLLESMVQNRMAELSALDALDTQITNAAPKRGFLIFK